MCGRRGPPRDRPGAAAGGLVAAPSRSHDDDADPPRTRRPRRLLDGSGRRSRTPAARDHRPTPAGDQPMSTRTRARCGSSSTARSTTSSELRAELEREGHRSAPRATPRSSCTATRSGAPNACSGCAACSRSRCGTSGGRRSLLARDRVGKKPLFYAWCDGGLAVRLGDQGDPRWPGVAREADLEAIHHYLTYHYVPAPLDGVQGRAQSAAGIAHGRSSRTGETAIEPLLGLPSPASARRTSAPRARRRTDRALLEETMRLRMVSDVPLGAFLSGGVDSSAVVAMMARNSIAPSRHSASDSRRQSSTSAGMRAWSPSGTATDHNECIVRPDARKHPSDPRVALRRALSPTLRQYRPITRAERATPRTVALNGDGGDESFLGYSRYSQCLKTEWVSRIPRPLRGSTGAARRCRARPIKRTRVGAVLRLDRREGLASLCAVYRVLYRHDKVASYDELCGL